MRITPLDVRKQEFRRVVRGLDADEVYAFLATVADEYEVVLTDNKQLREKVIDLDEKVEEYRNMEKTLRDTLLTAERVMSEARQNARKEAELILRDATLQASQQTAGIRGDVEALKAQLRELRGHRDAFLARLQSLAEAQVGLVESYRRDFEVEDRSHALQRDPGAISTTGMQSPTATTVEDPLDDRCPPEETSASWESAEGASAAAGHPQGAGYDPRPVSGQAAATSNDRWREYDLSSVASPAPAPPVETRVDELEEDPPFNTVQTETPESFVPDPPTMAPPMAAPLAVGFAEDRQGDADVSVEQVAQAMAEIAGTDAGIRPEPLSAWPAEGSSGQSDETVAPYPRPETDPSPPYTEATEAGGEFPSADELPSGAEEIDAPVEPTESEEAERSTSRWSLARFTRGLGGF